MDEFVTGELTADKFIAGIFTAGELTADKFTAGILAAGVFIAGILAASGLDADEFDMNEFVRTFLTVLTLTRQGSFRLIRHAPPPVYSKLSRLSQTLL